MIERFGQQQIDGDPSKFSFREEAVKKIEPKGKEKRFPIARGGEPKETDIYIDQDGERFHKIPSDRKGQVATQRLVAFALKGVVNVSDIVKIGDEYYSHEQNLDKVEPSKDMVNEAEADKLILGTIFEDRDHEYYRPENLLRQKIENGNPNSLVEHQNVNVDEEKGSLNFYDFSEAMLRTDSMAQSSSDLAHLEKRYSAIVNALPPNMDRSSVLYIVRQKVRLLLEQYQENEFNRFVKIVGRSGLKLDDQEQKNLFINLKLRLELLERVASKDSL